MRISDWSSDVCSSDLPGDAALARLAVDADHCFVAAPQVGGVDGEVGDLPLVVVLALARGEALLDSVLMADRKSVVSGKSVSVRVDLGGTRTITTQYTQHIK